MKKIILLTILSMICLNSVAHTEYFRIVKAWYEIDGIVTETQNIKPNQKLVDYNDNDIILMGNFLRYVKNSIEKVYSQENYVGVKRLYVYDNEYIYVERYIFGENGYITNAVYYINYPNNPKTLRLDCIPYE